MHRIVIELFKWKAFSIGAFSAVWLRRSLAPPLQNDTVNYITLWYPQILSAWDVCVFFIWQEMWKIYPWIILKSTPSFCQKVGKTKGCKRKGWTIFLFYTIQHYGSIRNRHSQKIKVKIIYPLVFFLVRRALCEQCIRQITRGGEGSWGEFELREHMLPTVGFFCLSRKFFSFLRTLFNINF